MLPSGRVTITAAEAWTSESGVTKRKKAPSGLDGAFCIGNAVFPLTIPRRAR